MLKTISLEYLIIFFTAFLHEKFHLFCNYNHDILIPQTIVIQKMNSKLLLSIDTFS